MKKASNYVVKKIRCSSLYVCRNVLFKLFVLALEAVKGIVISFFSVLYKHALKNIPCLCNRNAIRGQEILRIQKLTYRNSENDL